MDAGIYIKSGEFEYTQIPGAYREGENIYFSCPIVPSVNSIAEDGFFFIDPLVDITSPYWSASKSGFYWPHINRDLPSDAIKITKVKFKELLEGQAAGQKIISDEDGLPILATGSSEEEATTIRHYIEVASSENLGHVKQGSGLSIDPSGLLSLLPAASGLLGGMIPGLGLLAGEGGQVDLQAATDTLLGGVKIGQGVNVSEDGTISVASTEYNLPTASSTTLGGVKVGSSLNINSNGVLDTGPITVNITTTGSGNAITSLTRVNSSSKQTINLTATKGSTFLLKSERGQQWAYTSKYWNGVGSSGGVRLSFTDMFPLIGIISTSSFNGTANGWRAAVGLFFNTSGVITGPNMGRLITAFRAIGDQTPCWYGPTIIECDTTSTSVSWKPRDIYGNTTGANAMGAGLNYQGVGYSALFIGLAM